MKELIANLVELNKIIPLNELFSDKMGVKIFQCGSESEMLLKEAYFKELGFKSWHSVYVPSGFYAEYADPDYCVYVSL